MESMGSGIKKLTHFLVGFLSALSPSCCLSVLGFLVFSVYELVEYIKKHDTLYLEFREYGVGFFAGVFIRIVLHTLVF